jgi:uroporphyrinogen-III synthase
VARSPKPKKALADHMIRTDLVPLENTAEGIAKLLAAKNMKGKKIAILWHGSYSPILKDQLESAGGNVFESSVYSYSLDLKASGAEILTDMGFDFLPPDVQKITELIQNMSKGEIDVITFTSPPSVRNLFSVAVMNQLKASLEKSLRKVLVVAIGPPTRKTLEEYGVNVDIMPDIYKMGPMLKALGSYLEDSQVVVSNSTDEGLS